MLTNRPISGSTSRTGPIGDRGADHDVLLAAVAVQEDVEQRQQGHERCGAEGLAQRVDLFGQRFVQRPVDDLASVGLDGRARPIGRQLQGGRRLGQVLEPIADLRVELEGCLPLALPEGIVAVLDFQWRQRRCVALGEGLVEGHEFTGKHGDRPAVSDDVMQGQQQDLLLLGDVQQRRPQQRSFFQGKQLLCFSLGPGPGGQ